MSAVVPFVPLIASVIGAGAQILSKPKAPKAPAALVSQPTVTPRSNSVVSDALSARRGAAANQRTGTGGAESSTGKKTLLGQ